VPGEFSKEGGARVLTLGMVFSRTMTVAEEHAARHLAPQGVKLFSTPEMVRFMERCVVDGLQPYLEAGQSAVGIHVDIRHLAPTPVGVQVTVTCALVAIDRRRFSFAFEVWDAVEKIGEGRYESFVVERSRQQHRLAAKLGLRVAPLPNSTGGAS